MTEIFITYVSITYDCCNRIIIKQTCLKSNQTLLANAALGDTLIMQADQEHDLVCTGVK